MGVARESVLHVMRDQGLDVRAAEASTFRNENLITIRDENKYH